MKRTVLLGLALSAALVLGWFPAPVAARDEKKEPPDEAARVYVVMIRGENQRMYVLEKTKVQKLGDVSFLTGKLVGTVGNADWRIGSMMWLPLADITQINEYDSLADVQKIINLNK